ncbi:DUF397 domain-containing protein [Streptomyces sp. KLOTTS4A1]|uniref:DUF397 domain-containing protein n=1 Tax=Streptomyces sp. KLOTTS4A1 TaxID=3390996 RepID=UPI0039F50501
MPSQRSDWFKSSYSGQNGECVEARLTGVGLEVRDSKNSRGAVIAVRAHAWGEFLEVVKSEGAQGV